MTRFFMPPIDVKKSKIVIGYDGQIKLMVYPTTDQKWTKKDFANLEAAKIDYLEKRLGYKIEKLEKTITHDNYEKYLKEVHNT